MALARTTALVALIGTHATGFQHPPTLPRAVSLALKAAEPEILPSYDPPAAWLDGGPHNLADVAEYERLYAESVADPGAFWTKIAAGFEWRGTPLDPATALAYNFDRTQSEGRSAEGRQGQGAVFTSWFAGSTTNLAYNALDRQIDVFGRGDQVAMYAERNEAGEKAAHQKDSYTYSELRDEVNKLATALRARGVQAGDRVAVFMAHVPENCIAMLACARIGAVHSVVFGGFSKEALAARIVDCGAAVVLTQDGVMRGTKLVGLKRILDDAIPLVEKAGGQVQATIVLRRLGTPECAATHAMVEGRDAWWEDATAAAAAAAAEEANAGEEACPTAWVDAEHPAFILYTSGSTGSPKGVVHSTGGYMLGAATSFKYTFDTQAGDVFFCTADCGWITGHSYVTYGPLFNGATQIVFEGVPSYPTASRLWEIVDKHQVTHLYTAPTAIRAFMGAGDGFVTRTSRKSLKLLGSVGEPINPEAWRWYFEVVGEGRCPIVDTYWQTETGMHMITPLPTKGWALKPGSASRPFFGVQPCLLTVEGAEVADGAGEGLLAIKAPWPAALRGVWGDQQRFEETYFPYPGYYLTGDGARRDADGYYWITGRVDDVVIVSGHNIGTAEVESAVVLHPSVAEAAAVGVDHPVKGQALYVFVWLVDGAEGSAELDKELKALVRSKVGAFAAPDTLHYTLRSGLPKTRSGKILRRILRKVAQLGGGGVDQELADLGDTSTLADPSVVDDLVASHADNKK